MTYSVQFSSRVLVIDDEESVRDSFLATLVPTARSNAALNSAANTLFDEVTPPAPANRSALRFEVDLASSGREAVWLVEQSVAQGKPYAVIFCDMRMAGWDGVETVERLRSVDQRAEVVFVTAYSDYSLEAIVDRAGANVGYFVKPFLGDEIRQLATKLVMDWNKARELESLTRTVTGLRGEAGDVRRLVTHLLAEICAWLSTESAALLRIDQGGVPTFELGVGLFGDPQAALATVSADYGGRLSGGIVAHAGGTGFGLAIGQRLVQAHGGEVVYRRVDNWSQFLVSIPVEASAVLVPDPAT